MEPVITQLDPKKVLHHEPYELALDTGASIIMILVVWPNSEEDMDDPTQQYDRRVYNTNFRVSQPRPL
jgi:hypothetical protein